MNVSCIIAIVIKYLSHAVKMVVSFGLILIQVLEISYKYIYSNKAFH